MDKWSVHVSNATNVFFFLTFFLQPNWWSLVQLSSESYRRPRHKLFDLSALQSWIMSGIHKEKMNGQNTLILPLLQWVWSLIGERRDEKDQGQSNLLLTHISLFFCGKPYFLLCVVITCSYIVLDKKVKNQRISDHIRAEGIIFSTSKFETSRGTWCILYHTLYFILSHFHIYIQLLSFSTIPLSIIALPLFPCHTRVAVSQSISTLSDTLNLSFCILYCVLALYSWLRVQLPITCCNKSGTWLEGDDGGQDQGLRNIGIYVF